MQPLPLQQLLMFLQLNQEESASETKPEDLKAKDKEDFSDSKTTNGEATSTHPSTCFHSKPDQVHRLQDTLAFRIPSHNVDSLSVRNHPGVWGHEYVRHLAAEFAGAYHVVQSKSDNNFGEDEWIQPNEQSSRKKELRLLAKLLVPFLLSHNGKADVIDLLECESIIDIVPFTAECEPYPVTLFHFKSLWTVKLIQLFKSLQLHVIMCELSCSPVYPNGHISFVKLPGQTARNFGFVGFTKTTVQESKLYKRNPHCPGSAGWCPGQVKWVKCKGTSLLVDTNKETGWETLRHHGLHQHLWLETRRPDRIAGEALRLWIANEQIAGDFQQAVLI
ncbi:hypothetical protein MJO28_012332 [Puccinia striiformis f. sp. tritici]|uniref:Uncharacterized protein n=1 Tax=Puccinia striiformis f. sp. tritici TaxID=168172 RepID=A0ACC0E1Q9_9BASI|nr:hypothetical protein MJO28_012332 [Puccinia striiformis f. sp. tritici]